MSVEILEETAGFGKEENSALTEKWLMGQGEKEDWKEEGFLIRKLKAMRDSMILELPPCSALVPCG